MMSGAEPIKHLMVTVTGVGGDSSSQKKHLIDIEPGTTVGDVLEKLKLPGYLIGNSRLPSMHKDENLYPLVADGEELHASPSMVAGRSL
jgi:hypothetical protein